MAQLGWTVGQVLSVLAHIQDLSRIPETATLSVHPPGPRHLSARLRAMKSRVGPLGPPARHMADSVRLAAGKLTGFEAIVIGHAIRTGLPPSLIAARLHRRKDNVLKAYRRGAHAILAQLKTAYDNAIVPSASL